MKIKMIAATDDEFGIGKDGALPWCDREDMRFFKKYTVNSAVIMGSKTFESLNKTPLKDRINIVIGETYFRKCDLTEYSDRFVLFYKSVDELIIDIYDHKINHLFGELKSNRNASKKRDFIFIGGSQLYKHALEFCDIDELVLSHIPGSYDCDTFFPVESIPKFGLSKDIRLSDHKHTYYKK